MGETGLDPQTEALLETLGEGITPPTYTLSVEEGRKMLDDLFVDEDPEPVGGVLETEIQGPEEPIPLNIYAPEGEGPFPVLVFSHGGGWVRGSLEGYDGLCRKITNRAEALVVSVDYRCAPEHPFPAGFEDCYAATKWAAEHAGALGGEPDRLAIGGDSAGGNLTAAVALAARDRDGPEFDHQVLIYPAGNPPAVNWLDSYDENATGYLLELDSVEWYLDQYCDPADYGNQYAFPLRARDFSGLPPATVITAGFDPIRDEGIEFADRLQDAGVGVDHLHYESQIHAFISLYEHLDDGEEAIEELSANLKSAFEEQ